MPGLSETLHQAIQYIVDPDNALNFAINMHWPNGEIACPRCESKEHSFFEHSPHVGVQGLPQTILRQGRDYF
jgi:transposase-like zinc ribbon protein